MTFSLWFYELSGDIYFTGYDTSTDIMKWFDWVLTRQSEKWTQKQSDWFHKIFNS